MNRNNDYFDLINELDIKAECTSNTLKKAKHKLFKRKIITGCTSTFSGIVVILLVFMILLNSSVSFAYACGRIPVIKDVAKMMALSPSLQAAINNKYVIPVNQEKTINDITCKIEFMIADEKEIDIFFSLSSDIYQHIDTATELLNIEGNDLEISYSQFYPDTNDNLYRISVAIFDDDSKEYPEDFCLRIKANGFADTDEYINNYNFSEDLDRDNSIVKEYDTIFDFNLFIDKATIAKGDIIDVNKKITIDDQEILISTVEVYPTHIRVNVKGNDNNTMELASMDISIEASDGTVYNIISNGISSTSSSDGEFQFMLESPYFTYNNKFTLNINSIKWLEKEKKVITVDLYSKTCNWLPDFVKLNDIQKDNNNYKIVFEVKSTKPDYCFNPFSLNCYDEYGNIYSIGSCSSEEDDQADNRYLFINTLYLYDYTSRTVLLNPLFTTEHILDKPISIKII